jgi:hypothetical protein
VPECLRHRQHGSRNQGVGGLSATERAWRQSGRRRLAVWAADEPPAILGSSEALDGLERRAELLPQFVGRLGVAVRRLGVLHRGRQTHTSAPLATTAVVTTAICGVAVQVKSNRGAVLAGVATPRVEARLHGYQRDE